jgi:hypothetical protein
MFSGTRPWLTSSVCSHTLNKVLLYGTRRNEGITLTTLVPLLPPFPSTCSSPRGSYPRGNLRRVHFEAAVAKFQPGQGGRPKGSRNRLASRVFDDIFAHWCEPTVPGGNMCKGQAALEILFKEKPGEYLRLTASVLPKEFIFESVTSELDDEQMTNFS